jgi:hypothetical protein
MCNLVSDRHGFGLPGRVAGQAIHEWQQIWHDDPRQSPPLPNNWRTPGIHSRDRGVFRALTLAPTPIPCRSSESLHATPILTAITPPVPQTSP